MLIFFKYHISCLQIVVLATMLLPIGYIYSADLSSITQPSMPQTLLNYTGSPVEISEYEGKKLNELTHKRTIIFQNAHVIQEKTFDSSGTLNLQTVYYYSDDGNLTHIVGLDATGQQKWKYIYTYDEQNRLTEETSIGANNIIEWIKQTTYDDQASTIERQTIQNNGELTSVESFTYNQDGNITESITRYGDGQLLKRTVYTYSANGLLSTEIHYDSSGPYEIETYSYQQNLPTLITCTNNNGQIKSITKFTYDADSHLITLTELNPDNTIRSKKQYIYDAWGNRIWIQDETIQTLFDITYSQECN